MFDVRFYRRLEIEPDLPKMQLPMRGRVAGAGREQRRQGQSDPGQPGRGKLLPGKQMCFHRAAAQDRAGDSPRVLGDPTPHYNMIWSASNTSGNWRATMP